MGTILSRDELKRTVDLLKSDGKKVVFTNGCFDILHVGHVRYLAQARALGDVLIVGLNSNASVSRLKPGRPINDENQRAEVLAALAAVDYVTVFDEDTPYELISFIRPDVLVKGGDWSRDAIVGADLVSEVHGLCFVDDVSTTRIIAKILSSSGADATMNKKN